MGKIKEHIYNHKNLYAILLIALICLVVLLPFVFADIHIGHDIAYHFDAIRSLNQSYQQGSFGQRVYEFICQDFGYGTGLFYSMLPASICVIIMNVLKVSVNVALSIEFFIVIFSSGIIVYFFAKRLFKKTWLALIVAISYAVAPYLLTDIYWRFAFSEIFLYPAVALIFFGIYELVENNNFKLFFPMFTVGFTLSFLFHVALTVWIAIFILCYFIFERKKFFKRNKIIAFSISCAVIILICSFFYIPLLANYSVVNLNNMSWNPWPLILEHCAHPFLIVSSLCIYGMFIIFCINYFKTPKQLRTEKQKLLFFLKAVATLLVSPLFPWMLTFGPFRMIQFPWRLFLIHSFLDGILIAYLIQKANFKKLKISTISFATIIVVLNIGINIVYSSVNTISQKNQIISNSAIYTNSYLSNNQGTGSNKNGDYYPKGATKEYIFNRANSSVINNTNLIVTEFANYQQIKQISFIINEQNNGYVILNLPYDNNLIITQQQEFIPFETTTLNAEEHLDNGNSILKISTNNLSESCKVIINYENSEVFETYLQVNPFEFITKSGDATVTNFVKINAKNYSADILLTEKSNIELPSLFYNGYKINLTTANGEIINISPMHNENGFIEIEVEQSGKLEVLFAPNYITLTNIITICGICLFIVLEIIVICVPNNKLEKCLNLNYKKSKTEQETE